MTLPTLFQISIPDSKISDLKQKLSLANLPTETSDAGWDRGAPLSDITRLTKAWETHDWRAAESSLNQTLPQFTTPITVNGFPTIDLHFIHQPSSNPKAIPLLFVHGWPGSFLEVSKILPLLSDAQKKDDAPAFHVVAPSLPNFGFSSGITTPGFGNAQYAECFHSLMLLLGYTQYVTQGGDLGFMITRALGILYPESVKASHINMILVEAPAWTKQPILALQHALTPYTNKEKEGLKRSKWFLDEGWGYNLEQSTKPQTLAYALTDSPVALLSWIYEKLHDWSDDYPFTDEEILTWVSIYYFSYAGPGAAHRIYYEGSHADVAEKRGLKVIPRSAIGGWVPNVKLGLAWNPKEIFVLPRKWGKTLGNVVYEVENETGGHFYAHERPEWLVRDLVTMFGKKGGAFGVVEGKDGY